MKNLLIGILAVTTAVFGALYFTLNTTPLGAQSGPNHFGPEAFYDEVTLNNCGTATYSLGALSPYTAGGAVNYATTSVTVTGLAIGDTLLNPSFASGSIDILGAYQVEAEASVAAADTATVMFINNTKATSTAVAGGTIKACYFD